MKTNYTQIYNDLYSVGYLAGSRNGGKSVVRHLCHHYTFDTILDVGCSQGAAVQKYHKYGKDAYGVDVSEIAIERSKELNIPNCVHGSILDIPFPDKQFDAVVSTDMLEHLDPSDVEQGIKELIRVSSKYLFLKIATRAEGERQWLEAIQEKRASYNEIENLHLSIFNQERWIELIEQSGEVKLEDIHRDLLIFSRK